MSVQNLVLFPKSDGHRLQSYDALLAGLREIGLIGEPSRHGYPHEFEQGHAFFSLVRFRTHHMVVELVPDERGEVQRMPPRESTRFCSIRFAPESEKPDVLASSLTEPARCPKCRLVDPQGYDTLGAWWEAMKGSKEFLYLCSGCGERFRINDLDWQHAYGVAWYRIEIQGVRRDEATPSEKLVEFLQEMTGVDWDYCYYRM